MLRDIHQPHSIIPARTGTAFILRRGDRLSVTDVEGGQVSDLVAFSLQDPREYLSNGRTFDYEETIRLTTGAALWSDRSNVMLKIVGDTVGRHDFMLTPCSIETFRHFYPDKPRHHGCLGNLASALLPFGIEKCRIPVAFNCFMNVTIDSHGRLSVAPPTSKAGDYIIFEAKMDLIIGLTACSAYASNGGTFKPVHYQIIKGEES